MRKFSLRFPLKRIYFSVSELDKECWKQFTSTFLFAYKMALTHIHCYFTPLADNSSYHYNAIENALYWLLEGFLK